MANQSPMVTAGNPNRYVASASEATEPAGQNHGSKSCTKYARCNVLWNARAGYAVCQPVASAMRQDGSAFTPSVTDAFVAGNQPRICRSASATVRACPGPDRQT